MYHNRVFKTVTRQIDIKNVSKQVTIPEDPTTLYTLGSEELTAKGSGMGFKESFG